MKRKFTAALITPLALVASALIVPIAPAAVGAEDDMTTVTMNFTGNGCEGCTAQAHNDGTRNPAKFDGYESNEVKVKNSTVTFSVPTEKTNGMYFSLYDSSFGSIDALPLIVMQYAGADPGASVPRKIARNTSHASPCWSGTTEATATLNINVRSVRLKGLMNKSVKTPIAWAAPTQQANKGFSTTVKGVLATQDDWFCGANSFSS